MQTLPVLEMLRARFPDAHLAWVVKGPLAGILEGHPQLDAVLPMPYPKGLARKAKAMFGLMRQLRAERFDLVIDLQGLFRSGLLSWATRAKRRVGSSLSREFAHWGYTDRIEVGPWHQPALETYVPIARALGCAGPTPPAVVAVSPSATDWAHAQLHHLPRPLLAIHPGAQWVTKRWPPQSFARLAQRAAARHGAGIVLVGGPGEAALGQEVIDEFTARAGCSPHAILNLAGQSNLQQLAALCQQADVFLSGDTGPLHLASALKTPVVGVFTCTDPVRSGPRRDLTDRFSRCVATSVSCAASYVTRCGHLSCMGELTPERVWPAVAEALAAADVGNRGRQAG